MKKEMTPEPGMSVEPPLIFVIARQKLEFKDLPDIGEGTRMKVRYVPTTVRGVYVEHPASPTVTVFVGEDYIAAMITGEALSPNHP